MLPISEEYVRTLNRTAALVHTENLKWWIRPTAPMESRREIGTLLMLIVSELAEAMEGHRKSLRDTHLPQHPMFHVELADALIRIFDLCGAHGIPIGQIMQDKLLYNRTREDHTHEARSQPGGKSY